MTLYHHFRAFLAGKKRYVAVKNGMKRVFWGSSLEQASKRFSGWRVARKNFWRSKNVSVDSH